MKFFVILNNQQEGPYTIAQLAEMGISAETLVWKEGMKDWQPEPGLFLNSVTF